MPFIPTKISAGYIIRKAVKFANLADAVIVPTDSIIPILRKWGVENKNIIPIATGVLEEEFVNADKNKIREKYNIKSDEVILLIVSRLTTEKNVEFVFRSIRNVLKNSNPPLTMGEDVLYSRQERVLSETKEIKGKIEFKDFHKEPSPELDYQLDLSRRERWGKIKFLVVGDGYLRRDLENFCQQEKISDKIIFCGEVERIEIKNFYACADIFVYGSKSETQGMIITEAMYMSLPIVAVNATGINSLVLNNGNGFLVSENESEFSGAVLKLINNKELRKNFSEASKRIAELKFTASICAKKMLEVYRKCLNH